MDIFLFIKNYHMLNHLQVYVLDISHIRYLLISIKQTLNVKIKFQEHKFKKKTDSASFPKIFCKNIYCFRKNPYWQNVKSFCLKQSQKLPNFPANLMFKQDFEIPINFNAHWHYDLDWWALAYSVGQRGQLVHSGMLLIQWCLHIVI